MHACKRGGVHAYLRRGGRTPAAYIIVLIVVVIICFQVCGSEPVVYVTLGCVPSRILALHRLVLLLPATQNFQDSFIVASTDPLIMGCCFQEVDGEINDKRAVCSTCNGVMLDLWNRL
jgi:hypothetical protein